MRFMPASPAASLVSHSRWPWMVTSGGATSWKSASKVVFVEGTMTPTRLRRPIATPLGRKVNIGSHHTGPGSRRKPSTSNRAAEALGGRGSFAVLGYGIQAGNVPTIGTQKVTVHVDRKLLRRAQERTGQGVSATVRHGLELVAASEAYERIRSLRGKVRLSIDLPELRRDRR